MYASFQPDQSRRQFCPQLDKRIPHYIFPRCDIRPASARNILLGEVRRRLVDYPNRHIVIVMSSQILFCHFFTFQIRNRTRRIGIGCKFFDFLVFYRYGSDISVGLRTIAPRAIFMRFVNPSFACIKNRSRKAPPLRTGSRDNAISQECTAYACRDKMTRPEWT
jgi:hypothetical protein